MCICRWHIEIWYCIVALVNLVFSARRSNAPRRANFHIFFVWRRSTNSYTWYIVIRWILVLFKLSNIFLLQLIYSSIETLPCSSNCLLCISRWFLCIALSDSSQSGVFSLGLLLILQTWVASLETLALGCWSTLLSNKTDWLLVRNHQVTIVLDQRTTS